MEVTGDHSVFTVLHTATQQNTPKCNDPSTEWRGRKETNQTAGHQQTFIRHSEDCWLFSESRAVSWAVLFLYLKVITSLLVELSAVNEAVQLRMQSSWNKPQQASRLSCLVYSCMFLSLLPASSMIERYSSSLKKSQFRIHRLLAVSSKQVFHMRAC